MLPADFVQRITDVYENDGAKWLEQLPALITRCEQRWDLRVHPPFPLSYNYVTPATRTDGTAVVLKLGVPGSVIDTEMAALRHYDGHGVVQLLDADDAWGALLIERLVPGTMLAQVEDDEQTTIIAAGVMQQLWRPIDPGHPFPTTETWGQGFQRLRTEFDGGTGPFPKRLVEMAETLFRDLLASQAAPVLLHGDLHHYNILEAERQPWLALDPQGVVGEPAYEVGALLRNPSPHIFTVPNLKQIQAWRADLLAEALGVDRERIVGWSMAQAVLSGWWSFEDHGSLEPCWLTCAEVLAELM
jgi:streptomycin 6-kinase